MQSMNMEREILNHHECAYRGAGYRNPNMFYPWASPTKLETYAMTNTGGSNDMMRCYDVPFSACEWWQVEFKIYFSSIFTIRGT